MSELNYVGRSLRRKDGPDKVTGKAVFTQDVKLPNTLIGRVLRSPHPHARIVRIDTTRAKALPGVKAVITVEDTKGIKHGFVETPRYPPDQEVLARGKVVHVGEEIAAVAAIDQITAQRALELIDIDYEILPAPYARLSRAARHPRALGKRQAERVDFLDGRVRQTRQAGQGAGPALLLGAHPQDLRRRHFRRQDRPVLARILRLPAFHAHRPAGAGHRQPPGD